MMCVTAFYLNPSPREGSYRLVLAFNRDEYFSRPTQPADWWPDTDVVAGRDLTEGRVGGTWLGVHKAGRLAFLLNFFQSSVPDPTKKGRGSLVKDFLLGESSAPVYMREIAEEGPLYNPFHLICMDLSNDTDCGAYYYTNTVSSKEPTRIENGFHGLSNFALEKPWPKACHVKACLEEVVHSTEDEDALVQRLLDVFSNDQRLDGEEAITLDGTIKENREAFRATLPHLVMVKTPIYGTRSTTVLVVNTKNEARFVEKYLEDPIDVMNPSWKTAEYKFMFGA